MSGLFLMDEVPLCMDRLNVPGTPLTTLHPQFPLPTEKGNEKKNNPQALWQAIP